MDAKFTELVEQLNGLDFKGMYGSDFLHTWDKTTDELKALYIVADALRELRENNVSSKIFDSGLAVSLFRDNSTRTRFSFSKAANLLGLELQDLDEKKSQIAHGETVRETATMISFMADVIGIRDDMYIGKGDATWPRSPSPFSRPTRTAFWIIVPRSSPCSPIPTTPRSPLPTCSTSSTSLVASRTSRARRLPSPGPIRPLTASRCPARSR